jgi:hypothetical protein
MGAMITIEYDDEVVSKDEIETLAESTRLIVIEETGIKDVFVYANSAQIKINVAPVEIFIQAKPNKLPDPDAIVESIAARLISWKQTNEFSHKLNVTVMPVDWHLKLGI